MKTFVSILFVSWIFTNALAEGTAQLRPTSSDYGNVQVNDVGRPFALESNTDSLHRLYIHIKNSSEKIYFGFQPKDKTSGHGTFRIKDPSGTVVYARTNVPVAAGAGYINTYAEAVAGPKIAGFPSGGYSPLTLTPTITGDYYIEFTTTLGAAYHFDLFDITVVDNSNIPILGRLWSYAWDLNTQGALNTFNGTMYIYSNDKYITSVFLNGIQPWGFVVSCNSKGTKNTGNPATDRQSCAGNSTYPEFKVFLSKPDTTVYTQAIIPTMIEDLSVIGSPITGSPVKFYLNMNKGGTVELFLDLDGTLGYQAGNKDVVIVKTIKAGGDTIIWDGKDAQGTFVVQHVTVGVTSRFATGVTHLPIYDPEYNANGFIVNRITPNASRAAVYWDDSKFGGTVNFIGASGNNDGHNFPDTTGGYGNNRTINTWWNGFENDNLKSFSFTMDGTYLPICISSFSSLINGSNVMLDWQTLSETNNNYFEIQRSSDGIIWEILATIKGANNSNYVINYNYIDRNPLKETSFYRLKQVDNNGISTYTIILSVSFKIQNRIIKIYPNPAIDNITIDIGKNNIESIQLINSTGIDVYNSIYKNRINLNSFSLDISILASGFYIFKINGDANIFIKQ